MEVREWGKLWLDNGISNLKISEGTHLQRIIRLSNISCPKLSDLGGVSNH
jgi:hypothetical protein